MPEARWKPAGGGSPGGIESRVAMMEDFGGPGEDSGPGSRSNIRSLMEDLIRRKLKKKAQPTMREKYESRWGGAMLAQPPGGTDAGAMGGSRRATAAKAADAKGMRFMPKSISTIGGGTYVHDDPTKLSLRDRQRFGSSETVMGAASPTTYDFGAHLDPAKAAGATFRGFGPMASGGNAPAAARPGGNAPQDAGQAAAIMRALQKLGGSR